MTRIAFSTLGCKVNQYDTAAIETSVSGSKSYTIVPFNEEADIYVVNTCTVTGKGDVESRRLIRKAIRKNGRARIIVTGCYAQTRPDEIAEMDGVSMVLGNKEKYSFMDYLSLDNSSCDDRKIFVSDISEMISVPRHNPDLLSVRTRAFLKVQDGCDSRCSYCIVPFARGRSRSLEAEDVIRQVSALSQAGYREIVLCGVHLGGYGRDLTPKLSLNSIIENIIDRTDVHRIRLSSIEPREISDELIELVASEERLCKHFHIPMQSGDDRILQQMNRNYDTAYFEKLVWNIRGKIEDAGIGCDIMVGYPGEEDINFQNTCRFIEKLPITYLHVFSYSPRSGTAAYSLKETVPGDVKRQRSEAIRSLGNKKDIEFKRSHIGKITDVLIEEDRDDLSGLLKGYTGNYLKTLIIPDNLPSAIQDAEGGKGQFVRVHNTGMINDNLSGTILSRGE